MSLCPVVYLESTTSNLFLEKPEEIDAYQRILGRWWRPRWGRRIRELIATLASELYADREDYDDRA